MLLSEQQPILSIPRPILKEEWLGNRSTRRKNRNLRGNKASPLIGRLNRTGELIRETSDQWNQVVAEQDNSITKIVFQGKPFIHRWLDISSTLPQLLQEVHLANLDFHFVDNEFLNEFDKHDIFSHSIGELRFLGVTILEGTSLSDIEQMPLLKSQDGSIRLERSDIRRINRMFHDDRLSPPTLQKITVRQAMIYLATQDLARPEEKIVISSSIEPLHQRLRAYFDYYKDLMANFDLGLRDERSFLSTMVWSRPWLPQAVGLFTVARLGITPSSAIRFYQTRAENSWAASFWWRRRILPYLEAGTKDAVRKNNLPAELRTDQYYNAEIDKLITKMFLDFYGGGQVSEQELMDKYNRQRELTEDLVTNHFKFLQDDIARSPKRYLEFDLNNHPLFEKVILTSQNRQALIFISRLKGGEAHLTLEIDNKQEVYGLPAELLNKNPHILDLVVLDILQPVLDKVKSKQTTAKPIQITDYRRTEPIREDGVRNTDYHWEPVERPRNERFKPQRSVVLTPIARLLEGPQPANIIPLEAPKFVVFHTREKVASLLGKNSSERDIDRAMKAIADFEQGRGDYKRFKKDRVEGEDIWELRAPKLRVLLSHMDEAFFNLSKVDHRREIFNIRQRER